MMLDLRWLVLAALLAATCAHGADRWVDRVGDTAFVRVDVNSFAALDARQQQLAYWLAQAAIAIDPITYDQFSRFGLRQKRLLEGIAAHGGFADGAKLEAFTKLFWANHGNHNEVTGQKSLPTFAFGELRTAAQAALRRGAFSSGYGGLPPLRSAAALDRELELLRASLFDADFEPFLTAKNPGPGQDILTASSNTFYEHLTLAELKDFKDRHALNSRLVRGADGALREQVYRAGTPDGKVPPGLYAEFLRRANGFLAKAQKLAEPAQAKVIGDLIHYYETGAFSDWLQFDTDWVQDDATVDFAIGFIEIYRDARGAKGSSQAFVSVTDKGITQLMVGLSANAEYFEQRAPWDEQYKKRAAKPPVVKAIETVVETGDFSVTTIGDNLPNENVIREKYGSKNFLFTSSTRALNAATAHVPDDEFAATPEVAARLKKFGDEAEDLSTAMHEIIGHGSGRLSARLAGSGSEALLKEYFSTLEEARADLMALWNAWDPKLRELGLASDPDEVAKAMYDRAVLQPLTQLQQIPRGDTIEEDHLRDRQLIVNFVRARVPGAIEQFRRDGKTYSRVVDYEKMHSGVGILLAELMRIKAEGDYPAIKALIDEYAVHFDPALRDEVMARFKRLDLPTYWAGINARLVLAGGQGGAVRLTYPASVAAQFLDYAAMYDRSIGHTAPASGADLVRSPDGVRAVVGH